MVGICTKLCSTRNSRDLDKAFSNYFRRLKQGETPGFPKLKKRGELCRLYFPKERFSINIDNENRHYLKLSKLDNVIRIDVNRPYIDNSLDKIISCNITYERKYWWICLLVEKTIEVPILKNTNPPIGIDAGITKTYTLSNGYGYQLDSGAIKNLEKRKSCLQRRLKHKIGTKKFEKKSGHWIRNNAAILKIDRKIADIRQNFNHQTSADIVNRYSTVVVEKLNIKNMSASASGTIEEPGKNVKQKSGLNRSILRQGWGQFYSMLEYKAKSKGVNFVTVNPAYTSQMCSACGYVDRNNRISQASFKCLKCGHTENADINAAKNILKKAPAGSPG